MFGFLGLLFALNSVAVSARTPPDLSLHATPSAAAVRGADPLAEPLLAPAADAPMWPVPSQGSSARGAPLFPEYRPEEWVSTIAQRLHVGDTRIAQAAIWISAWPVRVDISPNRVYVALRFHGL